MIATIIDWAALANRRAAGALCFGLCLALVAFGIYVMFSTK